MSMSAKELHYCLKQEPVAELTDEANAAILRALSLLSSVEDGDGIVRNAKDAAFFLRRQGMHTEATAVDTAAIRITLDAQEKAALQATLDEVSAAIGDVRYMDPPDGGDVPIAEQVRRMRAELASVKAERDALKERIWQIRVELGALFTMLPNEVPGLAMEVCERDADRQCLFRAFELAAHKEGA